MSATQVFLQPHACAVFNVGRWVCMNVQVHGAITGKGTAKLPWEVTPLDTQIRQQLGVFRKVVLQLLDRNPDRRPSMQDFCAACERVFAQTQSITSSSEAGLQVCVQYLKAMRSLLCGCSAFCAR